MNELELTKEALALVNPKMLCSVGSDLETTWPLQNHADGASWQRSVESVRVCPLWSVTLAGAFGTLVPGLAGKRSAKIRNASLLKTPNRAARAFES
jgi:hypothetical protein